MMELDLNELERLAEAATQGPWIACGPSFGAALPKYLNEVVVDDPDSEEDGIEICQPPTGLDKESSRDMEFIGAANPAVVLELVRRLREAEEAATLFHAVQHACGELPEGWNIIIDLENGAGFPELYNSEGEKIAWSYGDDGIAQTVIEMVQLAKMRPPKNED